MWHPHAQSICFAAMYKLSQLLPLGILAPSYSQICNKIKTKWMQQITVFIDLQDQLNMFRTKLCPSSGA
jgi:hypothetical protein